MEHLWLIIVVKHLPSNIEWTTINCWHQSLSLPVLWKHMSQAWMKEGGSMLIIILWDNDVKEQLTHQTDELCGRNLFKVCIYCIHFVVGGLNLCFRAKLFNILKQYYLSVPVINNKLLGSRIDCKIDWIVELLDWCCCRHLSIWLLWSCCVLSVVVRRRRRRNTSWWIWWLISRRSWSLCRSTPTAPPTLSSGRPVRWSPHDPTLIIGFPTNPHGSLSPLHGLFRWSDFPSVLWILMV